MTDFMTKNKEKLEQFAAMSQAAGSRSKKALMEYSIMPVGIEIQHNPPKNGKYKHVST